VRRRGRPASSMTIAADFRVRLRFRRLVPARRRHADRDCPRRAPTSVRPSWRREDRRRPAEVPGAGGRLRFGPEPCPHSTSAALPPTAYGRDAAPRPAGGDWTQLRQKLAATRACRGGRHDEGPRVRGADAVAPRHLVLVEELRGPLPRVPTHGQLSDVDRDLRRHVRNRSPPSRSTSRAASYLGPTSTATAPRRRRRSGDTRTVPAAGRALTARLLNALQDIQARLGKDVPRIRLRPGGDGLARSSRATPGSYGHRGSTAWRTAARHRRRVCPHAEGAPPTQRTGIDHSPRRDDRRVLLHRPRQGA